MAWPRIAVPSALKKRIWLLLLFTIYATAIVQAGVICKKTCVNGYEDFCLRSSNFIGNGTYDHRNIVVYIERDKNDPNSFSFASNVLDKNVEVGPGDAVHSTKIIGFPEAKDLSTVISNLSSDLKESINTNQNSIELEEIKKSVKVIIDEKAIGQDGKIDFDFSGVNNVEIVDKDSRLIQAEVFNAENPPPSLVGSISGCCLKARFPQSLDILSEHLDSIEFRARRSKIVNLAIDSETETALKSGALAKRLHSETPAELTTDRMSGVFEENRGGTLVILGHVEGGKFVSKDSGGAVVREFEFSALESLALDKNVQLIYLGCRSSEDLSMEMGGIGIAQEFKTSDAVKNLERAFSTRGSIKEFLTELSNENFTVIVDAGAFGSKRTFHADVMADIDGYEVKVADLGYVEGSQPWSLFTWFADTYDYFFGEG